MRLNEIDFDGALPIDGYGPGFFRIGGAGVRRAPCWCCRCGCVGWGGFDDTAPLLVARADEIDVLFVGTGAEIAHIPAALSRARWRTPGSGSRRWPRPRPAAPTTSCCPRAGASAAALLPV